LSVRDKTKKYRLRFGAGPKEEDLIMAKCCVCGKGVVFGHNVSHSNRKTNRTWKPNIRKVKAVVGGSNTTVTVCSRCLRSGKIERA
jgi:large subunit ribosomal protein L28